MTNDPLPLFPLQVVLFPGELLPLHIFEERYKEMVGMCLEENLPFGVVLAEKNGIRRIGCTARIDKVLQQFPDGRMNIITRGEERFRIHWVLEEKSYLTAHVEGFGDMVETPPPDSLVNEVVQALAAVGKEPELPDEEILRDSGRLSFRIGAALKLPLPDKQALLESDSPTERLRNLVRLIAEKKQREDRASHLNGEAARNGHPKKRDA